MPACYFIGAGLHTALGRGVEENLAALDAGLAPPSRAVAHYAGHAQELPYRTLRGSAPAGNDAASEQARLDAVLDATISTALEQAGLSAAERTRLGLFIGSSSFDIAVSEAQYREALRQDSATALPLDLLPGASLGQLALGIRARHGLAGPDFSFNTACTASANALLHADAMVRSGRLSHALVIGVETFNAITALGFQGLQLLSPGGMKPFDPERNGLVLGEACAALVLGTQARAGSFFLRGGANLCDTHSMSVANPDGSTVALVMRQALRAARLEPRDITALKVHGTAALLSDEAEAAGMRQLFQQLPPLCALKPWLGHTLGACGLNELLLFCAAAERGFLIGTPGIAAHSDLGVFLNQQARALPTGNFMLNYFGFGGNNTSLIVTNTA